MPKNLGRPLTSRGRRKDRDDVDTKFGEGPLGERKRLLEVVKLVFRNRPGAGRLAFACLIHNIVSWRNLLDTLGFIQYSISSLT
ncbi:unnamed protein product [Lasius platythorax]|uniref:Transposase n=1 Tax=Lasius platythorax TaxID=488582 RepID=A0AAV2P246_9HYME